MEKEKVRLQKYLANQGVASRRAVEKMITEGRIELNGKIVDAMGVKINPDKDKVKVDGKVLSSTPLLRYILLFKPAGYICSAHDERGRRTVLDLLNNDISQRIYPVGRLDYNTSGLLLLTNDGDLTHKLLHPSHKVKKTYLAEIENIPTKQTLDKLRRGIRLSDGMTAPAEVRIIKRRDNGALLEMKIYEGRNRQVRRMLDTVGHPVKHLRRSSFSFLDLTGLKPGEWRELNIDEVKRLKQL